MLPGQSRGVGGADMPRQLRLADLHPGHHAQVAQVGGQRLQPETMESAQQVALYSVIKDEIIGKTQGQGQAWQWQCRRGRSIRSGRRGAASGCWGGSGPPPRPRPRSASPPAPRPAARSLGRRRRRSAAVAGRGPEGTRTRAQPCPHKRTPTCGASLHGPASFHYFICTFQTDVSQWTLLLLTLKCS